jgi:hypothetical protein
LAHTTGRAGGWTARKLPAQWRAVPAAGALLCLVLLVLPAFTAAGAPASQPSACPPRALSHVSSDGWSAARAQLAPTGPVALRLCRYLGSDTSLPLGLARSRLLTQPKLIAHLVDEFDTLPPYPRRPFFCPLDDESQVLALLVYSGGERVTVALDRTGCRRVTNGDLVRIASGYHDTPFAQRLNTELWKLTSPDNGNAHVTGFVRLCGGPSPGRCFTQNATVTVVNIAGDVVAAELTSRARFSFMLRPGTYTLVATTGGATGQRTIVLMGGHTRRTNVVVPMR